MKAPTAQQLRIISLQKSGLSSAEIAANLRLDETVVKAQLTRIRGKVKAGWQPPLSPIEALAEQAGGHHE